MSRQSVLRAALGLSVAVCATVAAASPDPAVEAGAADVRAFIDPVTGALREATAADLAGAAAAHPFPQRTDMDAAIILHADGMRSLILDDSFLSTSVAKIGPDGSLITGCVATREEYDAFFAATPTVADGEVR